ncbi:UNVERIFIED_CONTAM: hypothetical protein GTU68_027529 [Idotea baltica]|nr:hypothetical protein [Idotea baltica]
MGNILFFFSTLWILLLYAQLN